MPAATHEFYSPDLMTHIEGEFHDVSDASFQSHDTSFQSHSSYQQSYHSFTTEPNLADELFPPNATASGTADTSFAYSAKQSFSVSSDSSFVVPSANTSLDSVTSDIKSERQEDQSAPNICKEIPDELESLHQYADLLQISGWSGRNVDQIQSPESTENPLHQFQQYYEKETNEPKSNFMSWTCKHPENWTTTEVLDWLYHTAEKNGMDCSQLRGESFRTVSGNMLCKMRPDDFCSLDPVYGQYLYTIFRQLVSDIHFSYPIETTFSDASDVDSCYHVPCSQGQGYDTPVSPDHHGNNAGQGQDQHAPQPSTQDYLNFPVDGISPVDFGSASAIQQYHQQLQNFNFSDGIQQSAKYEQAYTYEYQTESGFYPHHTPDVTAIRAKYENGTQIRRRPGRPRIKSIPTEEELQAQREKKLKSQHLWEFIFEMLNNPAYNPSILKWENQSEGVFRFIQSESVAQLWGTLKSNGNMTYEKLSRAMRHYYKRGILERVEGRRLVYKFSLATLERMKEKRNGSRE